MKAKRRDSVWVVTFSDGCMQVYATKELATTHPEVVKGSSKVEEYYLNGWSQWAD